MLALSMMTRFDFEDVRACERPGLQRHASNARLSQAALARTLFFPSLALRLSLLRKDYAEACNRVPVKPARRAVAVKQQ